MADKYDVTTNPHFSDALKATKTYLRSDATASGHALSALAGFAGIVGALPEGAKMSRVPFYGEKVEGAAKGKEYPTKSRVDRLITYGRKVAEDETRFGDCTTPSEYRKAFEALGFTRLDDVLGLYGGGNSNTDPVNTACNAAKKFADDADAVARFAQRLTEDFPGIAEAIRAIPAQVAGTSPETETETETAEG